MKCIHCQGVMKRGTTPFHVDRKGAHLTLDAVVIQDLVRTIEQRALPILVKA